jgi:hypothetical protein
VRSTETTSASAATATSLRSGSSRSSVFTDLTLTVSRSGDFACMSL